MKEYLVTGLDHFGRGIIRDNGIPIFVENALIGEVVTIEVTKTKKNFKEAKVIDHIKTSSSRIKPECPYYDKCGGCDIMHMSYEEQLRFKENKVKEVMNKFEINTTIKPIIPSKQFGYRNKVTLQCGKDVGYFQKHSYDIVDIDECLIANDSINKVIKTFKNSFKGSHQVVIRANEEHKMIVTGEKVEGDSFMVEKIGNFKFHVSPKAFFQVNNDGMIKLYNKVLEYADLNEKDKVLDLYCGTGTIGIYVSPYCKEVLGVEINDDAVRDAIKNKELNNISNIDFKAGDVKDIIEQLNFKPNVIIVDPPRSGLDKKAIDRIIEFKPNKIIYVSCDAMTLGRDLKALSDFYDIVEITPVDMFPNTHHVENVSYLKIKKCN